jgi:hypothetical protein
MNTSVDNFTVNILSGDLSQATSTMFNTDIELSKNNFSQLLSINSFLALNDNWDSYGAKKPNAVAMLKAVNFIVSEINPLKHEVFFTVPTADGDILVEIKNNKCNIELIFSGEVADKIICSCNGDLHAEGTLNETTFNAYIKWLFR